MSKSLRTRCVIAGVLATLSAVGCGEDSNGRTEPSAGGTAGAAGTTASSGKAGRGSEAGRGANAGTPGSGGSDSSGEGGAAGDGETSGRGGSSGDAGAPDQGGSDGDGGTTAGGTGATGGTTAAGGDDGTGGTGATGGSSGTAGTAGGATEDVVLELVSGDQQSKRPTETLDAVVLRVKDLKDAPLAGKTITIATEPGAAASASLTTDAQGRALASLRLGRALGQYVFAAQTAGSNTVSISATAVAPADNTMLSLVNTEHAEGIEGIPGPGTVARVLYTTGLALATNDTVYLSEGNQVLALSPAGHLTLVAGTGEAAGPLGDLGPATQAKLSSPGGLALDEDNGVLFIADTGNQRIRAVDLGTGVISTYAGGGNATYPGWGDGGLATGAVLDMSLQGGDLAIGPDDALYVADDNNNRLRRIHPTTGIITEFVGAPDALDCENTASLYDCHNGCQIEWAPSGDAVLTGRACGPGVGVGGVSVLRRSSGGALSIIAGRSSGGTEVDGVPASTAYLPEVRGLAIDAGGNVFLSLGSGNKIRRIEAATGRITTVGGTGTEGGTGDLGPASSALLAWPSALAVGGDDHLYVADYTNSSVRSIWAAGDSVERAAVLSIAAGDGQSARLSEALAAPFGARLRDPDGGLLAGYEVDWRAVDSGGGVLAPSSGTQGSGVASALARVGLATGTYRFEASFHNIYDEPASGSPLTFQATAVKPAAGTLFTIVNVEHAYGSAGVPGPATLARIAEPTGVTRGSDGTLYLSAGNQVFALSPAGHLTLVAGTGEAGPIGDLGPATQATLSSPGGLALDEGSDVLFIADTGNQRIRAVDLGTGLISTYAGGGDATYPGWGDGGLATDAVFDMYWRGGGLAIGPDGALYVADDYNRRFRRIHPTTRLITAFVSAPDSPDCSNTVSLYDCGYGCQIAWAPSGDAIMTARACGPAIGSGGASVLRRSSAGALTVIAGRSSGGTEVDGVPASTAYLPDLNGLAIDANGNIFLSLGSGHKIRRIAAGTQTITTITGNGTSGFGGEYGPASGGVVDFSAGLASVPGGGLVFADYTNAAIRRIWGASE